MSFYINFKFALLNLLNDTKQQLNIKFEGFKTEDYEVVILLQFAVIAGLTIYSIVIIYNCEPNLKLSKKKEFFNNIKPINKNNLGSVTPPKNKRSSIKSEFEFKDGLNLISSNKNITENNKKDNLQNAQKKSKLDNANNKNQSIIDYIEKENNDDWKEVKGGKIQSIRIN